MNPIRVGEVVLKLVGTLFAVVGGLLVALVGIDTGYRRSALEAAVILLVGLGALALGMWLWRDANRLLEQAGTATTAGESGPE